MVRWYGRARMVPLFKKCGALLPAGLLLMIGLLSACGAPAALPSPTATAAATATAAPSLAPTSTSAPSATATFTPSPAPTATATLTPTLPPTETATPVPTLGVTEDGFAVWCAPLKYTGAFQPGAQAPQGAAEMKAVNGELEVRVPAEFCTLVYTTNQPAPGDLRVRMFDGNAAPFFDAPLTPAEGEPTVLFAPVKQPYVVDPPFWSVTYRVELTTADGQVLRSDPLRFARPLPEPCKFGGLPDPVTLYCAPTDPWEIEPKPGVKYPYPTLTPES